MNLRRVSGQVEAKLSEIFSEELTSGLAAREDSRAFGAMVEKKSQIIGSKCVQTLGMFHWNAQEDGVFLISPFSLKTKSLELM